MASTIVRSPGAEPEGAVRADGGAGLQAGAGSTTDASRAVLDVKGTSRSQTGNTTASRANHARTRPEPPARGADHGEDALAAADVPGRDGAEVRAEPRVQPGEHLGRRGQLVGRPGHARRSWHVVSADPYDGGHGTRPRARRTGTRPSARCSSRSASRRASCSPRSSAPSSPGSLALLVDAGHMVVDTGGLGIGLVATRLARRSPDRAAHLGLPAGRGARGHRAGGDPARRRRLRDHLGGPAAVRAGGDPLRAAARVRHRRTRRQPRGLRGAAAGLGRGVHLAGRPARGPQRHPRVGRRHHRRGRARC